MRRSAVETLHDRVAPGRYASRVRSTLVSKKKYHVQIDDELRFVIEGDDEWPAQWQLFAAVDGVRAGRYLTLESEYWDVMEQLERGCFWLPPAEVVPKSRTASVESRVTRHPLPQYLSD
ncbi:MULTISPECIES: hypothetical protein [unclassified Paraburkholderia]|uniref:hypothetical protein n=1 Tax=unclassified Paraburkholderia TaxID=2615204 RepID=UPI002AAF504E|nr:MULTISPECIES: hypothetical protein [unclassified Paraburkholderia]